MPTRRRFLRTALWTPPTLVFATACSGARSGVIAKLDHGLPAALGGTMTFTLTAISVWDAPNPNAVDGNKTNDAEISFGMTAGLVPINLDQAWQVIPVQEGGTRYLRKVNFKANLPLTFDFTIKLEQSGDQRLVGSAQILQQTSYQGDSQTVFLRVTSFGSQVQRTPFTPTK